MVERISLLYSVFKNVKNGKTVQIPNIVLNQLWVDNITRSKAMREQLSVFVSFDTTFDDVTTLKAELLKFVRDKDNSRDFQPDLDIQVVSIAEMNKMELQVQLQYKGNWANETLRSARRSKFMCALVLALRSVPIYAPGGGAAVLGSADAPTYSVALPPGAAQANKDAFAAGKEAKRLVPSKPAPAPAASAAAAGDDAGAEYAAMRALSARPGGGADPAARRHVGRARRRQRPHRRRARRRRPQPAARPRGRRRRRPRAARPTRRRRRRRARTWPPPCGRPGSWRTRRGRPRRGCGRRRGRDGAGSRVGTVLRGREKCSRIVRP